MKLYMLMRKLEDKARRNKLKAGLKNKKKGQKVQMQKMQRKGQFYILTAIILIAFAIGIASSRTWVARPHTVLFNLKEEFVQESPKVINTGILEKNFTTNVTGRYDVFVKDFIEYAKSKNAMIDITYVLSYDNTMSVGNYYGEQITVNQNGAATVIQGSQVTTLARTSSINITAGNYTYDFEVESGTNAKGIMKKGSEILII